MPSQLRKEPTGLSFEGKLGVVLGILGILATLILGLWPLLKDPWRFLRWFVSAGALLAVIAFLFFRLYARRRPGHEPKPSTPSVGLTGLHLEYSPSKTATVISGREEELHSIWTFVQDARVRTSGLYWLLGQRGIGKTAILDAIEGELNWRPGAQYLFRGRCKEGGEQSPFFAIQMALMEFFAGGRNAEVIEIFRHTAPRWAMLLNLAGIGGGSDDWPGRVSMLPQTSPIPEICTFLNQIRERKPVILILDDAHWLDSETAALLRILFSGNPREKLCGIMAARREGVTENETLARLYRDLRAEFHGETAILTPLKEPAVHRMLGELLGEGAATEELTPVINEMTGGVPLAVVSAVSELKKVKAIDQHGPSGQWRLTVDISVVRDRLRNGLESLVDSSFADLDRNEQNLLYAGSIQGAEFDSRVVALATGTPPAECEAVLRQLSDNQQFINLVAEQQTQVNEPNLHFQFRHWVYQDSVRQRFTPSLKSDLSGKIAAAIETEFPERTAQISNDLAELYGIAREWTKEREYRVITAKQQLSLGAYPSAINSARRAAALFENDKLHPDPAAHRDVMVVLGVSLTALQGYGNEEAQDAYRRSLEIATAANLPEHFPSRYGVWMYNLVRGNMMAAKKLATEMLDLALRKEQLARDRSQAMWAIGVTQYFMGDVVAAKLNFEAGIRNYREEWHAYYCSSYVLDPGVANRYLLGRALVFLGYPDQARSMSRQSLELAGKLKHVESLAFALVSAAVIHAFYGATAEVKTCAAELFDISTGNELRQHRPWAHILRGWAVGVEGEIDKGMHELQDGLSRYEAMGAKLGLAGFYAMEADLCRRQGLLEEEDHVLDKATRHMEEAGQLYYWAEFMRLRTQNRRSRTGLDVAQTITELQEARRFAIAAQARAAELRIVTDLAVAQGLLGDLPAARQTLEAFLGEFKEGADTADSRRARQTLDDLKSRLSPKSGI